jgi:DedD protein
LLEQAQNDQLIDQPTDNPEKTSQQPKQTDEERRMAQLMAKNLQAAKADDNAPVDNTNNSGGSTAKNNSLAQQTVVKSKPDTANNNAGWVVQLGSFGNQKNVNELLQKLEKAGYRSFSRKVQTSAGRLTKVFVGPELDKEKLDLALPHLKETTGLTGKITTFDVVSD